jgi:peptidylprolyl isomerase
MPRIRHSTKARPRQRKTSRRKVTNRILVIVAMVALVLVVIVYRVAFYHPDASPTPTALAFKTSTPQLSSTTTIQASIQETPHLVGTKTYSSAPPMLIDVSKQYFATVKMATGGEFVIQLYPDKAPIAVNSFVFLARQGYFDGVTFHRVLSGFMAQGGDPTGTGTGGPGYTFGLESNDLTFDKAGVVAMANTGLPNSNGSQFFITFAPETYLNGNYTIFGQVTSGMDIVEKIRLRNPDDNPDYPGDAMQSVTITEK